MLFNFIKFDLYNGIFRQKRKIAAVFGVFLIINLVYANLIYEFVKNGVISGIEEISTGDFIMYYLAGISEYIPDKNTPFPLPFLWIFQMLGCCFFCLYYPVEDLYHSGKHRLILCGNRFIWWISKCIWLPVNVVVYYLAVYSSSLVVSLAVGAKMSSSVSEYTTFLLKLTGDLKQAPYEGSACFILVACVVIAICMIQMLLSLVIKPLYSFVFAAGYLLAAAYFKTPYLIGNYAMPARSELMDLNGFSVMSGGMTVVIVYMAVLFIGFLIFRGKDIL